MLDFMVLGLPRCGTTWAANWLTTEQSFCVHDPLWTTHYRDLDETVPRRAGGRVAGVSCTGLRFWSDWIRKHPCRKVVLHRDVDEIYRSLERIGMLHDVPLGRAYKAIENVAGLHVPWTHLFDPAEAKIIWEYLTRLPFDAERHAELVQVKVEPKFDAVVKDAELQRRFASEPIQL